MLITENGITRTMTLADLPKLEAALVATAPEQGAASGVAAVAAGFGVWQLIETAPKDGTRILCSYRGNRPFIARWRNDFSVFMDDWDSWRDATHWMPLPPSPNTQLRNADDNQKTQPSQPNAS